MSEARHRLTFVSHAGEEKPFVSHLLSELNVLNVATFFDDNMAVGTDAEAEMKTRAAEADQAVVILSWSFLTKKWPMKELNIFLGKGINIHLLYLLLTPDDLRPLLAKYDRQVQNTFYGSCSWSLTAMTSKTPKCSRG